MPVAVIIIIIFLKPTQIKAGCINSQAARIFYINVLIFQFAECVTLLLINKTDLIYIAVLFIDKGKIGLYLKKKITTSDIDKPSI